MKQCSTRLSSTHFHAEIYEKFDCAAARNSAGRPSERERPHCWSALWREIPLIAIDGPQLYSGGWEIPGAAARSFQKAWRAPCILFFDSIDAAPRFGAEQSTTDVYRRILSQLLRETTTCATSRE